MELRVDFAILENNPELVYFDSASTTLVPKIAVNAVNDFLTHTVASARRGAHSMATRGATAVENARKTMANFLNSDTSQVSFQKSIPSAIASFAFGYNWHYNNKDTIVIAENEEHSVLVALQRVAQILNLKIKIIPINENGTLEIETLADLIDKKTGIVAVGTTTVGWGINNPVHVISKIAHEYEAVVLSDISRSIAFSTKSPEQEGVDIAVFSGNVGLMGPPGLAVQWIERTLGTYHIPGILGGSSVANVQSTEFELALLPDKFESGIINVPAIVGLDAALNYLEELYAKSMQTHMKNISTHLRKRLSAIPEVVMLNNTNEETTIFGFYLGSDDEISCHDIALFLDESGIAVRSGLLCAHPLVKKVASEGIIQISLHAYNTLEEIDRITDSLEIIAKDLV
ncbi:MAG: aminotransferase class V-fold PLP-dependent enzyme [Candidatus Thorarchaeota archaeon]|nr:aminotransferase class V-fold PLP-dependent enzyme [Candidatus Thorarchaeota archaeon]